MCCTLNLTLTRLQRLPLQQVRARKSERPIFCREVLVKAFWVCFRRAFVALTALPGKMLTGVCLIAVVNCAVNITTMLELSEPQKDFVTGLLGCAKI